MSTQTIETRVVEMKFDNREFESNVKTSMSTLDKLKSALNLPTASKGVEGLGSAIKNLGFSTITTSIEKVSSGFSVMETIASGALQQIGASAYTAGKQLVDSFTIDPIKDGFSEYELKMDSVQTIMTGTGADLDTVMDKLNELNTYADKTIYSFSDMTNNIGKFTNAGVKLDDAVSAIQGVANVAAVSGANSNEASRAMYNFAQALSAGYVKLIDWKSIENANMATVEFKTQLLESAVAAGKLEKTSDGMYKVLTTNAQGSTMSDTISATKNFNDSLDYQWMTTDVLTKTLGDYADETTEIGKKAYAAAQDVKTFSQLIDTLKEAVGSGWAETWEYVFGDFAEAKQLWTGVNKVLSNFIDGQSKARNAILKSWKDLGGRTELIKALGNVFNTLGKILEAAGKAFNEVFEPLTGLKLETITRQFLNFTRTLKMSKETFRDFKSTFRGFFALIDLAATPFKILGMVVLDFIKYLAPFSKGILDCTARLGELIASTREIIKETSGKFLRTEEYERLKNVVKPLGNAFKVFADFVHDSFINLIDYVEKSGVVIKFFGFLAYGLLYAIEQLKAFFSYVYNLPVIQNIIKELSDRFNKFVENFSFEKLTKDIQDFWEQTKNTFLDIKNNFTFENIIAHIKDFIEVLKEKFETGKYAAANFADQVGISFGKVRSFLSDNIGGILAIISGIGLIKAMKTLKTVFEAISNPFEMVEGLFKHFGKLIDAMAMEKKANAMIKMSIAIGILALSLVVLSRIKWEQLLPAGIAIAAIIGALIGMSVVLKKLSDADLLAAGKSIGLGFIMIAGAIAIMVASMKLIETMDEKSIRIALGVIALLIAGLLGVSFALSKIGTKELVKSTVTLTSFSSSLYLLSKALKKISTIKSDDIGRSLGMLAVATIALAAISFTASKADKGSALTILAAALSLLIVANVLEKLASFNYKKQEKALWTFAKIMVAMVAIMYASRKLGIANTGAGFLALAVALVIIVKVVRMLGQIDIGSLIKGTIAVGYLIVVMGIFAALTRLFAGGNAAKIGITLLGLGAALLAAAVAITILSKLDPDGLARGVVAITFLIAAMSLLVAATYLSKEFEKSMIAIAVAIGVLAIALGALSMIDPSRLLGATASLGSIMAVLAILVASTKLASTSALPTIAVLTLVIAGLAFILYDLSSLNPDNVLPVAKSLSILILSLSAACILLGIAGTFGVTGLIGVGVLSALIIAVGGLLATLGAVFSHIDGYEKILDTGIAVFEKIGYALGRFAMSFAEGVTSVLPAIGTNLSLFATGLTPFLTVMKSIDSEVFGGAKLIADTIMLLTGASLVDSITNFFFGRRQSNSMTEMARRLSEFVVELKPFIDGISQIRLESATGIESIANAISTLTGSGFADNLQSILPGFDSSDAYQNFADGLVILGKGMANYSKELSKGYDPSLVSTSTKSVGELAELGKTLPNSGGVVGFFAGENDWATFGTGLKEFGTAMTEYSKAVADLDTKSVENSIPVGNSLVELGKTLPNSGGVVGFFAGENDWATFGTGLKEFGETMRDYSTVAAEIDVDAVMGTVPLCKSLSEIAKSLPNSGGVAGVFAGENDWGTFSTGLKDFGKALNKYASSVRGIEVEDVTNSVTAAKGVATIADVIDMMADIDNESLNDLMAALKNMYDNSLFVKMTYFGNAISSYCKTVEGVNTSKLTSVISSLSSVSAAKLNDFTAWANSLSGSKLTTNLGSFGESVKEFYNLIKDVSGKKIKEIGTTLESFFNSASKIASIGLKKSSDNLKAYGKSIKNLGSTVSDVDTKTIKDKLTDLSKAPKVSWNKTSINFKWKDDVSSSIKDASKEASKGGADIVNKFSKAIDSKGSDAKNSGKKMTSNVASGAKSKYSDMVSAGKYGVSGFIRGAKSKLPAVESAGSSVGNTFAKAVQDSLKIESPSRVMMGVGSYASEGLVIGILSMRNSVAKAGTSVAQTVVESSRNTMASLASALSEDMDSTPTIRPVIDFSDLNAGADLIEQMFSGDYAFGARGNLDAISTMMQENQNGASNDDVVSAINKLRKDISGIGNTTYNVNGVTYDDGSNITEAVRTLVRAARIERRT